MSARTAILERIRQSLGGPVAAPPGPLPSTARVGPRAAAARDAELDLFCTEVRKLSGVAERLADAEAVAPALAALVRAETVRRASLWGTPGLTDWRVAETLRALGVELVPPQAGHRPVAACELGVTEADGLLPETGTLVLRSGPARARVVSLLPRVHLAIVRESVLCADLHQAFAAVRTERYAVLITGPSRTADIELTLTLGVHGPKSLYVWLVPG